MSKSLIERTAIAPFNLDGQPIAIGQVVQLDSIQMSRAASAGVVYADEALNAAAPRQDLPRTQEAPATKVPAKPSDDLDDKTVADLTDIAKTEAVDLPEKAKKGDIVAAIRAKRAAGSAPAI